MQNQLPAGFTLQGGKYQIVKAIGQGGFGITYRADFYTEVTGALGGAKVRVPVAVKEFFFADHCTRDPRTQAVVTNTAITASRIFDQFKAKLIKEAHILSKLRHDNIVSVIDIFEENGTAYMVMDFVEGRSLDAVVRDAGGVLDQARAVKFASQLCYAVDAIHRAHVLHLDIKPGNILIDANDNVRVIDFGISKQYDDGHAETSTTPVGISKGYAPVEQYSDVSTFNPRTDIYAIGATIYYMLTGRTPVESITRVAADTLQPVDALHPGIAPHVADAVARAMAIRPDDRPASAAQLSAMLNATAVPQDDPVATMPFIPQAPSQPRQQPSQPQQPYISQPQPSQPYGTQPDVQQPVSGTEEPSRRPGGLRITMLCIAMTFFVFGIFAALMGTTGNHEDQAVGLSSLIITCCVSVIAAMIICPAANGIRRLPAILGGVGAALLYMLRYSGGIDYYYFYDGYTDWMMLAALVSTAGVVTAFMGYRRNTAVVTIILEALGLLLWCIPGF